MTARDKEFCSLLRQELNRIEDKGSLSQGDLEAAHKLVGTMKNLHKLCKLEEEENGYSERSSYDSGYSGRDRDGMGRFTSRDSGGGRGSYDSGYSGNTYRDHLDQMMREARDDHQREAIEEFRRKLGM